MLLSSVGAVTVCAERSASVHHNDDQDRLLLHDPERGPDELTGLVVARPRLIEAAPPFGVGLPDRRLVDAARGLPSRAFRCITAIRSTGRSSPKRGTRVSRW
jgi:hypothetical protein